MDDEIENSLATFSTDIQGLTLYLRRLIKPLMPDALETFHSGLDYIGYAFSPQSDRIVFISPLRYKVLLGFPRGSQLSDPSRLLYGDAKWLRYVQLHTVEWIPRPALQQLLLVAYNDAKFQPIKKSQS